MLKSFALVPIFLKSDFLKGFCPAGNDCKLKHFIEKSPEKKQTAKQIKESAVEVVFREKKIPPAKPKRKSLCQTPMAMSEKKARVRYYDERSMSDEPDETAKIPFDDSEMDKSEGAQVSSPGYEQKRQRLLRKVELAKQVQKENFARQLQNYLIDELKRQVHQDVQSHSSSRPFYNINISAERYFA